MAGNGEVQGKKKRSRRKVGRRSRGERPYAYPYELRRKAVQLCLEGGFPLEQVARELGVGFSTLGAWVRRYRAQGEAGLQGKAWPRSPRPQVAAAVKRQAVELKRRHPAGRGAEMGGAPGARAHPSAPPLAPWGSSL